MRRELRRRSYHSSPHRDALLPGEHTRRLAAHAYPPPGCSVACTLCVPLRQRMSELALVFTPTGLMHHGQMGTYFLAMLQAR